jgi:Tat protein translocase TatB subunit
VFDIGPGEFAVLAILGVVLVGPERLPGMLRQGIAVMRNLRGQISNARAELDSTIGPQVGEMVDMVAELNPKRLIDFDFGGRTPPAPRGASQRADQPSAMPPAPLIDADTP